jgi:hypothetical protein
MNEKCYSSRLGGATPVTGILTAEVKLMQCLGQWRSKDVEMK